MEAKINSAKLEFAAGTKVKDAIDRMWELHRALNAPVTADFDDTRLTIGRKPEQFEVTSTWQGGGGGVAAPGLGGGGPKPS